MEKKAIVIAKTLKDKLINLSERETDIAAAILCCKVNTEEKYISYLGISEENPHYISYLTSDRIARTEESEFWNAKKRYHAKPSKIIDLLFPNVFSQREKELFTEKFRNEIVKESIDCELISIVQGEDIAKYYNVDNYYRSEGVEDDNGGLFQSCMKNVDNGYFDIYTCNADRVAMAVVLSERGRVRGRCILWYPNGKAEGNEVWYDRIYATTFDLKKQIQACLEAKGFINISPKNPIKGDNDSLIIKLGNTDFDEYPYMDTMKYMNSYSHILYSYQDDCADYELDSTSGDRTNLHQEDTCTCDACDSEVSEDDIFYISRGRYEGYSLCEDCSVYSSEYGEYIYEGNAVQAERVGWILESDAVEDYNGDWIHVNRAVSLFNGEYTDESDNDLCYSEEQEAFIDGDDDFVHVNGHGYYHIGSSRIEKIDGDYYKIGSSEWEEAREAIEEDEEEEIEEEETIECVLIDQLKTN